MGSHRERQSAEAARIFEIGVGGHRMIGRVTSHETSDTIMTMTA